MFAGPIGGFNNRPRGSANGKLPGTGYAKALPALPPMRDPSFFVNDEDGGNTYFHVGWDKVPFPTETSGADLSGRDFSIVHSTGCSWKGSIGGLVKYLR
jgi:hypothetical protein